MVFALYHCWRKCSVDGFGDTPNSMRFAHTAVLLNSPDSHESGGAASWRIGVRAKTDGGVPKLQDGASF